MDYSHEQATHDEVNLLRLVRRLEKSVTKEQDWDDSTTQRERVWLQALGTLQKVKYGRKLLRNLEQYDPDPSPKKLGQRDDLRIKLDRIGCLMAEVQKRTEPPEQRPEPVLPTIPNPAFSVPTPDLVLKAVVGAEGAISSASDTLGEPGSDNPAPAHAPPNDGLYLSPPGSVSPPSDLTSPLSSLLPATPTSNISTSTAIAPNNPTNTLNARKQTSNALHEELSNQLAQMATQLKRNALHFSDSLEKDKAVVEETQQKLEGNFGVMVKERLRLRDFRGKSGSTTWMVVGIVIAVLVLFMIMVSVIRFSGR